MTKESSGPRVSVIIPSWTGEAERVLASLEKQTFRDYEVEVVKGVSPASRARNVGVERGRGDILLFIDDDAYFGHDRVLERLVQILDTESDVAVVGTSKLVPKDATWLQKAIARQVPRMVYPVAPRDQESNPPVNRYGFTAVSTTCCAVRRDVFNLVGGFDEELTTGPEDTDFFYRIRRLGHRIVVAGRCWVYHDPPGGLKDLLRKSFWYGVGHALEARKSPERGMAVIPLHRWYGKLVLLGAIPAFPAALFLHYYFDPVRRLEIGFRPLKTLSTYSVLCGYAYGWFFGKPSKPVTTYMGREGANAGDGPHPRKVLFLDAYPKFGGGQQVLLSIVAGLEPDRYEPVVALPEEGLLRGRLEEMSVPTVGVPFTVYNYTLPRVLKPSSVVQTVGSLARVVRDVVSIARRQDVAIIHANSAVAGVHALPAAALLGLPCVVHSHDFNTAASTNRLLTLLMRYRRSAMVFVSRALARHYGVDKGVSYRYKVIYNGVDPDVFCPNPAAGEALRREWGVPEDAFLMAAVGRLERWKGFDLLLKAFALVSREHPEAHLMVVGDVTFASQSAIREELVDEVRTMGLEGKVTFTGFIDDVPRVMAAIDALVHTPVGPEAFGLILIEAMACGKPVVAARSGGIPEIIQDGENGLLVPAGDAVATAAAMSRLMDEPGLAERLGERGTRSVRERFNVERQVAEVQHLYDVMLGEKATKAAAALPGAAAAMPETGL